jgi:hypothetical protein
MYDLIQSYKAQADVVLLDSPPLWYSDALALAPQVDGVLLAVSKDMTGRENTINAVESLRLVGARLIGTVFNRVKEGPAYFYYPTHAGDRPGLTVPSLVDSERGRVVPALSSGSNTSSPAAEPSAADTSTSAGGLSSHAAEADLSAASADTAGWETGVAEPIATFESDDPELGLASYTNGYRGPDASNKNRIRPGRNRPQR